MEGFILFDGAKSLIEAVMKGLQVIAPIVGGAMVVWQLVKKAAANDEMEHAKANKNVRNTIIGVIIVEAATPTIQGLSEALFPGALLLSSLCTLTLCICTLTAIIQTAIRSVEVALLAIVCPVLAINAASSNRSLFTMWLRSLIVTVCTQVLQLFMLKMMFYFAVTPFGFDGSALTGGIMTLLAFGWLIATIKTPKFIRRLTDNASPGVGGVMGGVARTGATMVHLVRALK